MTTTVTNEVTAPATKNRRRRGRLLTRRDKIVLSVMVGIPALIHITFVWIPALLSIVLSFGDWNGIGGVGDIKWIGTQNYHQIVSNYPPFWPAIKHNITWLVFFL